MSKLSLIAAMDPRQGIGFDGGIPWHLPDDFKHFKETTMGQPMIMGRKTFDSLPGVLPGRKHIVLSRGASYIPAGVVLARSVNQALIAAFDAGENPFVIGGEQIYGLFMDKVSHMYITRVHAAFSCDTHFPEIDWDAWELVSSQPHKIDETHKVAFDINEYVRRSD